jgi:hypothetical protein
MSGMSGPLTGDRVPAGVREFREKLQAWHLASAEWLGLDTTKVMRLELVVAGDVPEMYAMAKWESIEDLTAGAGHPGHTNITSQGVGNDEKRMVTYHQATYFDFDEGRALYAEVGPMPEMFSPAEKTALEHRFGRV